jgi:2,5-furandicarboxylate decarboxylase 1
MINAPVRSRATVDTERFRLRRFVERLVELGECDVVDAPTDLIDVAHTLDGNPKAVWFRHAGPEGAQLVGGVMGSRHRLALALETDESDVASTFRERLGQPFAPLEIASSDAPVHEVIARGEAADLTTLPVHLQHERDGAPYISASLDYAIDPESGFTNVGCRRFMIRGRRETGIDLNAPSDLRAWYLARVARGERLPIAIVVGAHPADFLAALAITPPMDELAVAGALRGSPVPVVKCVSNDVRVPADAEYVLEGYLDERGLVEAEGPYGEYIGYYGVMKRNPVFHLTAITSRRDALFQTATIGGYALGRTDTAVLGSVKTEAAVWNALQTAIREPLAVCCTPSCGGMYNVRLSMRQRVPGEARNAIAAVFSSIADVKHVFVVDDDIDVFSDEQLDWALATRFQADRDLVVASGFRAVPLDPSLLGSRSGAKAGFDLTKPFGGASTMDFLVATPPTFQARDRQPVREALSGAPQTFLELMEGLGTRDGREVIRALDDLYAAGELGRLDDGRYILKGK